MYQYIYNSRRYQRCISIFIIVGATIKQNKPFLLYFSGMYLLIHRI